MGDCRSRGARFPLLAPVTVLLGLVPGLVAAADTRQVGSVELGVRFQVPSSFVPFPVPPPHRDHGAVLAFEETDRSASNLLVTVLCLVRDSAGRPPVRSSGIVEIYQMMGGDTAPRRPLTTCEATLVGRRVRYTTEEVGDTDTRLGYTTVEEGACLFVFVFDYSGRYEARVQPIIRTVLSTARVDVAPRTEHLIRQVTRETSSFNLAGVPIPYPTAWRSYAKSDFDRLLSSEVSDHYYSELVMARDADVVIKAPLENEQLFSYAVEQWHMRMELSRLVSWGQQRLERRCKARYEYGYRNRSPGQLSERACAFRFDVRTRDEAVVIYDVLVKPRGGNILYVRFRTHPTLFKHLAPLFERYVMAMSY